MDSLERRIFLGALTVMAISGGLVITINSMGNVKDKMTNRALINALWKFDVLDEKALIEQKQWSWRKLVCAGVMGCSLIVSTFVRVLKPKKAIMVAVSVFLVWLTYLLYFWNSLNKKEPKEEKTAGKTDSAHHSDAGWAAKLRDKETKEDKRLPVTIITGYLGSGKTTLVKNILKNTIGLKVLVIENEIGEEGIDHQLLMPHTAKEEIILMSNGCVCCTGDNSMVWNSFG